MTTPVGDIPGELVSVDITESSATMLADAAVYPLDAVYGAAFTFIDRCYVFLDRPGPDRYRVVLSSKQPPASAEQLTQMVGEFANELLACAWRHEITKRNRPVIETVTMQAFAGAMGPPSLDELEEFDFTDEPFEDPLGIAQSWEDKYKKKPKAESGPGPESGPGEQGEG